MRFDIQLSAHPTPRIALFVRLLITEMYCVICTMRQCTMRLYRMHLCTMHHGHVHHQYICVGYTA